LSLKAKRVKQSDLNKMSNPVLDPDNYPARLVQVIEMGKRPNFFDPEKINHEIMLTYELVSEFMLDEKGEPLEDKPLWLSETINMIDLPDNMTTQQIYADQFKGKSKLVQRCKTFDPKGELEFDLSELLGRPCTLTVVQYQKKLKQGETNPALGNRIGAVTGLMKGMVIPDLINPPKLFTLDEPDLTILGSLPDWLQDKIKENLEFNGSVLQDALNGKAPAPKQEPKAEPAKKAKAKPAPAPAEDEEEDDEIPW